MQISIVLCTYNGSPYLVTQLDSLLDQSIEFDELIIIDDGSDDNTAEILGSYAAKDNRFHLTLHDDNQGVTHRYEEGIRRAKGAYVFLADQDDIWHADKLERMLEVFREIDPMLVFSDAACVDAQGNKQGYSLWEQVGFTRSERLQIIEGKGVLVTARHNVASGCCMAFHQKLKKDILPLSHGHKHLLHDRFILAMTVALYPEDIQILDDQLIDYRLHDRQTIGLNTVSDSMEELSKMDYYLQEAAVIEKILERVEDPVYRRAHYFWSMRAQAQKLPFLRRFIMLNTLLLEGDYKRNVKQPIRAALADLWG